MICEFITDHKQVFGVVPICRVLSKHGAQIAPRTYYDWCSRAPSQRALWDATLTEILAGYYAVTEPNQRKPESLYGSRKMQAHLRRQGIPVARCTVERLMAANGWRGVTRRAKVRTTVPDPDASRPPDLVDRDFTVEAPNRLWVADFTYVPLSCGKFVYTSLVFDAYANLIVGWEVSARPVKEMVIAAVRNAVTARAREGQIVAKTIAHNDAGSQYTSLAFGAELAEHGLLPSIGSVGDAYDNALAETLIGLYKTECIRADSPFRDGPLATIGDVEMVTAAWIHWYNTQRLTHRLGLIPPLEAEQNYHEHAAHPVGAQQ